MTVLFPTEVSAFDFHVENSCRTVQYKLNAQSLRLFGLHSDANDAHRAGANRLQNKQYVPEFHLVLKKTRRCGTKSACEHWTILYVLSLLQVFDLPLEISQNNLKSLKLHLVLVKYES